MSNNQNNLNNQIDLTIEIKLCSFASIKVDVPKLLVECLSDTQVDSLHRILAKEGKKRLERYINSR